MGRLIDADVLREEVYSWGMNDYEPSDFTDAIDDAPTVEAIPKTDYEAKLKTDIVTMLEELKKEIIELPFPQREPEYMQGYSYCQINILDYVIQDKINELRGEKQ